MRGPVLLLAALALCACSGSGGRAEATSPTETSAPVETHPPNAPNQKPAFAGQTKAPIVKGTQGYAVETVAKIDRPWSMAFLPSGRMLVSFRAGGLRTPRSTVISRRVSPRTIRAQHGIESCSRS